MQYAILVKPLSEEDGGGYLATVPDLPGCQSDGASMAEAVDNVAGAIESWKEAAEELGRDVPAPGSARGEWRQRVPKTLHAHLTELARAEGVSLNTFVMMLLAKAATRYEIGGEPTQSAAPAIAGAQLKEACA